MNKINTTVVAVAVTVHKRPKKKRILSDIQYIIVTYKDLMMLTSKIKKKNKIMKGDKKYSKIFYPIAMDSTKFGHAEFYQRT